MESRSSATPTHGQPTGTSLNHSPNGDGSVIVREFQSGDAVAFQAINEAWITRYFHLEPKDREALSDPQTNILDKGGRIFMAVLQSEAIGCCALVSMGPGEYEIAKMGVTDAAQGKGVGRRLLQAAIDCGRHLGAHRLYLETNHQLLPAIHLYRSLGFRDLAPEKVKPSPYARADVYMELMLDATR